MNEFITLILPYILDIGSTLLITAIGIAGTWVALKISQNTQLNSIAKATDEVVRAAQITVGELNQTLVEAMKAGSTTGKLTQDQIDDLKKQLLEKTLAKLSAPVILLLEASRTDINAIIRGAGEALINGMKQT